MIEEDDTEAEAEADRHVDPHVAQILDQLAGHPAVQRGVEHLGGFLDRIAGAFDRAINRGFGPMGDATQPRRPQAPPPPPPRQKPDYQRVARQLLGIPPNTPLTKELIQVRRRACAKLYHPDNHGTGSTEQMARVNRAADILLASLK
jgi:hypothetical protein